MYRRYGEHRIVGEGEKEKVEYTQLSPPGGKGVKRNTYINTWENRSGKGAMTLSTISLRLQVHGTTDGRWRLAPLLLNSGEREKKGLDFGGRTQT